MSCMCKIKSVITRQRDVTMHFVHKWLLCHNTTNNNVRCMAPYALMVKLTGKSMTVHIFALIIRCVNSFWSQSFIRSKAVSVKYYFSSCFFRNNSECNSFLQHGLLNRLWPFWLLQFSVLSLQEHVVRKKFTWTLAGILLRTGIILRGIIG